MTQKISAAQNEHRRYLFSVSAGVALFGAATNNSESLSLVAVAIEPTELSQISIADLVRRVATGGAEAIALLLLCNNKYNTHFFLIG